MKKSAINLSVALTLVVIFYITCTTIVNQGETGVLLNFGRPIKMITQPGIYLRFPYPFNSVEILDARLIMLQPRSSEFLTADKKNLILENNVCYRIADPIQFMKTVRNIKGLEIRLTDLLFSHTGLLLGHYELSDLINVNEEKIKFEELNNRLTKLMQEDNQDLGIKVERVFIKRVMLPYANRNSVYQRMRAERNRIAKKYIAEGEEKAQKIRAEADSMSRIIIAKANSEAMIIRGKAEAEAMKTYGDSYKKNIDFYKFIRSLEAYQKIYKNQATIVLDEKSPMLKTLMSGGEK